MEMQCKKSCSKDHMPTGSSSRGSREALGKPLGGWWRCDYLHNPCCLGRRISLFSRRHNLMLCLDKQESSQNDAQTKQLFNSVFFWSEKREALGPYFLLTSWILFLCTSVKGEALGAIHSAGRMIPNASLPHKWREQRSCNIFFFTCSWLQQARKTEFQEIFRKIRLLEIGMKNLCAYEHPKCMHYWDSNHFVFFVHFKPDCESP